MNHAELPLYVVAFGDRFVSYKATPPGTLTAFGDEGEAFAFAQEQAEHEGVPSAAFRVVEYRFTGSVKEA